MGSAKNRLVLGDLASPIITVEGDCIRSVTGILSSDILAQELANDTIEAVLDSVGWFTELSPADEDEPLTTLDGDPLTLADNAAAVYMGLPVDTPVWWYHGDRCLGQFYLQEIRRTGKTQFTLTAQSFVGLLDAFPFYGAVFNGEALIAVLTKIILTDGMVDHDGTPHQDRSAAILDGFLNLLWADEIFPLKIYGAIPICTKRKALQHVLFAYSLALRRTETGHLRVSPILATDPQKIPDSRIYEDGTVTIPDRAQRVELTEHSYWAPSSPPADSQFVDIVTKNNDEEFYADEYMVTFENAPIRYLLASGIQVVRRSPYAAVLSGTGTLKGYPYAHSKTLLSSGLANAGNVVSVTDAYMVTMHTSDTLLDTLNRYYSAHAETEMSIGLGDETLLDNYIYKNPYTEQETGYLTEMTITASGILKGDVKMISGFSPSRENASLSNYVVLTGTGEWDVPAEVLSAQAPHMLVVLIGGGDGGGPGAKGADGSKRGSANADNSSTKSNSAGARGSAGAPGKVFRFSLRGSDIAAKYAFSCGDGGLGGTPGSAPTAGGITTFGDHSSDEGAASPVGITNILTGDAYAKAGDDDDAVGGYSGYHKHYNKRVSFYIGHSAVDRQIDPFGEINKSGAVGAVWKLTSGTTWVNATTGDPGGAGFGEDGKDPGKPSINSWDGAVRTGNGGNGGNSTLKPPRWIDHLPTAYGYGGRGGYGGGGGGDAGTAPSGWTHGITSGTPGKGGAGGPGGDGSPGCIIIYY